MITTLYPAWTKLPFVIGMSSGLYGAINGSWWDQSHHHIGNIEKYQNNVFMVNITVGDDVQVDDDGEVVPISQGETGNVSKGDISADLSDALGSTASQHIGITSFEWESTVAIPPVNCIPENYM